MTRKNANATKSNETKSTKEVNTMTTKKSSKKSNAPASTVTEPATTAVATTPAVTAAAPVSPPTSISSADAARCRALLSQVSGILGAVTELSADDIRRSLKLRKGGAQVVPQLVDLCKQHGVTSVGAVTPDTLSAQKARADTLNTISVNFAAVGKALGDATFSAESSTWQQATTLYTVLQRLAVDNPTLAQGIQPVQAFFQTVRTKGTKREAEVKRKLTKAQKVAAKYEQPSGSAAAGPPPTTGSTGPSPATTASAPTTTSAPAPVAATPAAPNGVAHS